MAIITPGTPFGADLGQTQGQNPAEKVLASVNGKPITVADVDNFIAAMGRNGQAYNNPQGRMAVLEQLIAQRLFLLDAQRNMYEREPAFKEQLAIIKEQLLMEYAISKCVESVRVKDEEVKAFYDEHKEDFTTGDTVNASHILVDSEDKAKEILTSIQNGEITFEDAAKQYSSCPSSAEGGCLGDFGQGQMVPEFDTAVFEMEVGELRGPVKTQFGYHLIKLNAKNAAAHVAFADIKQELYAKMMQDKQQAAYQSKINQLKILYPVDKF